MKLDAMETKNTSDSATKEDVFQEPLSKKICIDPSALVPSAPKPVDGKVSMEVKFQRLLAILEVKDCSLPDDTYIQRLLTEFPGHLERDPNLWNASGFRAFVEKHLLQEVKASSTSKVSFAISMVFNSFSASPEVRQTAKTVTQTEYVAENVFLLDLPAFLELLRKSLEARDFDLKYVTDFGEVVFRPLLARIDAGTQPGSIFWRRNFDRLLCTFVTYNLERGETEKEVFSPLFKALVGMTKTLNLTLYRLVAWNMLKKRSTKRRWSGELFDVIYARYNKDIPRETKDEEELKDSLLISRLTISAGFNDCAMRIFMQDLGLDIKTFKACLKLISVLLSEQVEQDPMGLRFLEPETNCVIGCRSSVETSKFPQSIPLNMKDLQIKL